jgi:hypothetical protein
LLTFFLMMLCPIGFYQEQGPPNAA